MAELRAPFSLDCLRAHGNIFSTRPRAPTRYIYLSSRVQMLTAKLCVYICGYVMRCDAVPLCGLAGRCVDASCDGAEKEQQQQQRADRISDQIRPLWPTQSLVACELFILIQCGVRRGRFP